MFLNVIKCRHQTTSRLALGMPAAVTISQQSGACLTLLPGDPTFLLQMTQPALDRRGRAAPSPASSGGWMGYGDGCRCSPQASVKLLLSRGQRLRGQAGHGRIRGNNTFVPAATIPRRPRIAFSSRMWQNPPKHSEKPKKAGGGGWLIAAAAEAGAVPTRFSDNPRSMGSHTDVPL